MKKHIIVPSVIAMLLVFFCGCAREMSRNNPFDPQNVTVTGGGGGSGSDSYTKLLLHMDGSNASTVFTDNSTFARTVTAFGGAAITTGQSVFGSASATFNGTSTYLTLPASTDWDFGTGDFTIDFWVRRNGAQNYGGLITNTYNGQALEHGWSVIIYPTNNKVEFASGASGTYVPDITSSTALTDNTWTHVAIVRHGNTLKMYLGGVENGSKDVTGLVYDSSGDVLIIGRYFVARSDYYFSGNIDEARISKGIARWTANFTPPTAAY